LDTISLRHSPRERFFLHAASLDIPKYDVAVTAPEPSFWTDILDLLE
jgi:hypothetical protein